MANDNVPDSESDISESEQTPNNVLIARALQSLEESGDIQNYRDNYSGRAMYGKRCLAADINRETSAAKIVALIISECLTDLVDECDSEFDLKDAVESLCSDLSNVREDSMGLGTVVYWPRIQVPEGKDNG